MWWGSSPEEGEAPQPSTQPEVQDLRDQFEHQQAMIGQLKTRLRSNEENLQTKEKEVEEYASKLSRIKVQQRAKQRKIQTKKEGEEGSSNKDGEEPRLSEKASKGKMLLLRKQLEENRIKFVQRERQVTENKRDIEDRVEQLRRQVEERDSTIAELRTILERQPGAEASKKTLQEPSPDEVEARIQDMYAQVVYKDNKIVDLNNKILEMEAVIMDLQENLKEKDEVISARTRAVALMSEDLSRKRLNTQDTLDETRDQMRIMQNNFADKEASMVKEKEALKEELDEIKQRCSVLLESSQRAETARFEACSRSAELQEKVVRLQEESNSRAGDAEWKRRAEELSASLEDVNEKTIKEKAQHANKVKRLEKQISGLKKRREGDGDVEGLQNRIAELEEEKASESRCKDRLLEMEERIRQQSVDLDTHVHVISLLEKEKLSFLEGVQQRDRAMADLEETVKHLESTQQELEQRKVSFEMRIVELEEQLDGALRTNLDLCQQSEMQGSRLQHEAAAEEETDERVAKELENMSREMDILKCKLSEKDEMERRLQTELEKLNLLISDGKEVISELETKLQAKEDEITVLHGRLSDFESSKGDREEELQALRKQTTENESQLKEWQLRCSELEAKVDMLGEWELKCSELEKKLAIVTTGSSQLEARIEFLQKEKESAELEVKELKGKIGEITAKELTVERNLEESEMQLKEMSEKFVKSETHLKQMEGLVQQQEAEFSKIIANLSGKETEIQSLVSMLNEHKEGMQNFNEQQAQSLLKYELDLEQLTSQVDEEKCKNVQLSEHVDQLKDFLSKKEAEFQSLQSEYNTVVTCKNEEIETLKHELEFVSARALKEKNEKLVKLETKLKDNLEKLKKVAAHLKQKTLAVQTLEEKIAQLEREAQGRGEVEKWQIECHEKDVKMDLMETQLSDKTDRLVECEEKLSLSEKELYTLRKELEESTQKEEVIESKMKSLVEQLTEMEKEAYSLQEKLDEKESIVRQLQSRLEADEASARDLKTLCENLKEEKQMVVSQNEKLCRKLSRLESSLAESNLQINEMQERVDGLHNQNQALSGKLQESEAVIDSLEQKVEKSRTRIEHLEENSRCAENEQKQLIAEIELRDKRLFEAENAKAETEDMYRQQMSSVLSSEEHVAEKVRVLEADNSKLQSTVDKLNATVDELKHQVTESDVYRKQVQVELERMSTLESELAQSQEQMVALEKEVKYHQSAESVLKEEVNRLQRYSEQTDADVKSSCEQLEKIENEKKYLAETCEKLNEEKGALEESLVQLEREMEAVRSELEDKVLQVRNLQMNVDVLTGEKSGLSDQTSELNHLVANLQNQIEELQNQNQALKNDLANAQVSCDTVSTELNNTRCLCATLEHDKQMSEQQLIEAQDRLKSALNDLENVKEERRYLTEEKEVLLKQISDKDELNTMQSEIAKYNEVVQNLERELAASKEQIENLATDKALLESQVVSATEKVAKFDEEIINLAKQKEIDQASLQSAVSDLQRRCETVENEKFELTARLSKVSENSTTCRSVLEEEVNQLRVQLCAKDVELSDTQTIQVHLTRIAELETELEQVKLISRGSEELKEQVRSLNVTCQQWSDAYAVQTARVQELENYLSSQDSWNGQIEQCTDQKTRIAQLEEELRQYQPDELATLREHISVLNGTCQQWSDAYAVQMVRIEELENQNSTSNVVQQDSQDQQLDNQVKNTTLLETLLLESQNKVAGYEQEIAKLQECLQNKKLSDQVAPLMLEGEDEKTEGWGWSEQEVKMEAEYLQRGAPSSEDITLLKKQIETLEQIKSEIADELRASQVRSGKMVRKIKALKEENEALSNQIKNLPKNVGFSDLDKAIEDEYKRRVDETEKQCQELRQKVAVLSGENKLLGERADTLEASSEQLIEMKEKQDLQMEMLTKKNKDLQNQLEVLEWRISELSETGPPEPLEDVESETDVLKNTVSQKREECALLLVQLKDAEDRLASLEQENEAFQNLIEELRVGRLERDHQIGGLKKELEHAYCENEKLSKELHNKAMEVETSNDNIRKQYDIIFEIQNKYESLKMECELSLGEKQLLQKELLQLQNSSSAKSEVEESKFEEMETTEILEERNQEVVRLKELLQRHQQEYLSAEEEWKAKVLHLENKLEILHGRCAEETRALKTELEVSCRKIDTLTNRSYETENSETDVEMTVDKSASIFEIEELQEKLETKKGELDAMTRRLQEKDAMLQQISAETYQHIAHLEETTEELRRQLRGRDEYLKQLDAVSEEKFTEFEELLAERENEIGRLRKELVEKERTVDDADFETRHIQEEQAINRLRSELDLSLYTLHQRDVRCEELTLELTQLLEERDSLQLRLSNALRQNQELTSVDSSRETTDRHSVYRKQTSVAMKEETEVINRKLAELHGLDYGRDVALQDDRTKRHREHLRLLRTGSSPRRTRVRSVDESSNLMVERTYTLSRDSTTTTQVLLDWLWGRSTPRVMHL